MNRSSLIVKIGRVLQKQYKFMGFLDTPFPYKTKDVKVICLIASPRSGSTLTYQVLSDAFENNHLTNLSNLLYSTPTLAFKLQNFICKKYKSSFNSTHGFVGGVCGEAEGLKFWEYWSNQSLNEVSLDKDKIKKLHNRLKKLDNKPFITGYLGHTFSIEFLREEFKDNILFIELKRDRLSHHYSLYKLFNNSKKPLSIVPKSLKNREFNTTQELVVEQLYELKKVVDKNRGDDFLQINYEDICKKPNEVIKIVQQKAKERGINLKIKKEITPFKVSLIDKNKNEITEELFNLIEKRYKNEA